MEDYKAAVAGAAKTMMQLSLGCCCAVKIDPFSRVVRAEN
jgi:hypothetical protein